MTSKIELPKNTQPVQQNIATQIASAAKKCSGRKWSVAAVVAVVAVVTMVAIVALQNPTSMPKPIQPQPYQPLMGMTGGKEYDLRSICTEFVTREQTVRMPEKSVKYPSNSRGASKLTSLGPIKSEDITDFGGYGSGVGIKGISTWDSNLKADFRCSMKLTTEAFESVLAQTKPVELYRNDIIMISQSMVKDGLHVNALLEIGHNKT